MHTGSDYLVNRKNFLSRTFTVTFPSKQGLAISTEHEIGIADDTIAEGTEAFRLRIVAARFTGQAAILFRAGLTNTVADVFIEDNDCKFMNNIAVTRKTYAYIHVMHALSPPTVVEVSWIYSEPIEVTEGEGVPLELFAQAFGFYATPIIIGVVCTEVISINLPPGADTITSTDTLEHAINFTCLLAAFPGRDFEVISGTILEFTDVETFRSNSRNTVVLLIIDDNITEPCEFIMCTLQGFAVDGVRGVCPNRVTIRICDDDGEHK